MTSVPSVCLYLKKNIRHCYPCFWEHFKGQFSHYFYTKSLLSDTDEMIAAMYISCFSNSKGHYRCRRPANPAPRGGQCYLLVSSRYTLWYQTQKPAETYRGCGNTELGEREDSPMLVLGSSALKHARCLIGLGCLSGTGAVLVQILVAALVSGPSWGEPGVTIDIWHAAHCSEEKNASYQPVTTQLLVKYWLIQKIWKGLTSLSIYTFGFFRATFAL